MTANGADKIPVLKSAKTAVSTDGSVIQITLETNAGEQLRCGLTPEGVVNLATALLSAWKVAADRCVKKTNLS